LNQVKVRKQANLTAGEKPPFDSEST